MNESAISPLTPYRILAAIGGADHLEVLLALAAPLARARGGRVTPLYVGPVNRPPPDWLVVPEAMCDVVDGPITLVDDSVSEAVLDFARKIEADLLLLHWRSRASRGHYLLGRNLDPIIQYAPCDVAVLRATESPEAFSARMAGIERILVPSGGGPNASLAMEIALGLSGAHVTALRVAHAGLGPTAVEAQWQILNTTIPADTGRVEARVVLAERIADGILHEAAEGYDLLLLGATRESFVDRLLFGNLPQRLAGRAPVPTIIVRRREPRPAAMLRRMRWRLLNAMPQLGLDERVAVYRQVRRNARFATDFLMMIVMAAAIASLGLLLDSPAVIIGAMVVAPLMSSLLGMSMGIVQGDLALLRQSMRTALAGVLLVLVVSAGIALIVPGDEATAEMLSRGSPTLLDLAVALVSGAAAAYAVCRKDVSSALPGVAIAVALVPPLATVGLSAASRDLDLALGASLLFVTNLTAITAAAAILFLWIGFHPNAAKEIRARTFRGGLLGTAALLGGITLVLAGLTGNSLRTALRDKAIAAALESELAIVAPGAQVDEWQLQSAGMGAWHVDLVVTSPETLAAADVTALQATLQDGLQAPVELALTVVPVQQFTVPLP